MNKNKCLKIAAVVLVALTVAGMLSACSNNKYVCPAYSSAYRVEPLPY